MFSQTLSGYIYNEDRVPVSHADIIITDTEYSTISNSEGFFIIRNLKEGKYLISVSSLGYKTKNIEQKISKYQDISINIILETQAFVTDEITIRGERNIEDNLFNIPIRTKTISINEIQTIPAISPNKLFEGISGVNVSSEAGIFSSTVISLRGLGGNSQAGTLVVLDGTPINKSDAGSVNWNMIDKDNISSIEIIKGPGSAIYGSNAMGGIINISTRKPNEKFKGNFSSSFGTYNTFDSKLRLSGISDNSKYYWKSFISYRNSDGYINTPDEIIVLNDSIVVPVFLREYMLNPLAGYNIDDRNSVELSLTYFNDTKGRGVKIYEDAGANTNRNTIHGFAKYRGQIGDIKLFANVFILNEDYFRLNEYYSDGDYALYEIDSRRTEQGGKFIMQYPILENIELTAGIDLQKGKVKGADIYYTSTDIIRNRGNLDIYSGYFQFRINSNNKKFTIVPGLRYDFASFGDAMFSIENPSYSVEYLSQFQFDNTETTNWSSFSPKFSLEYMLNPKSKVFTTIAKGFRAPRLDDLCRSDQVRTGFRVANPEIKPEYLYSFELGTDLKPIKNINVGISAYYNVGKDFMYLLSTGDSVNMGYTIAPIYQIDNIGEVNIYGTEIDLVYSATNNVNLFANYTYNQSVIKQFAVNPNGAGIDLTGKYLTNIPAHKFSSGFSWQNQYVNISSSIHYNGTRWIKDDNTNDDIYLLSDKYPDYYLVDVKLWKAFNRFTVSVTFDNVFDVIYTNSRGFKNPGRMIIGEFKYDF
jgi:outer membrane receptor protein involved in Fe transport